jgi:hypothetical protein
MSAPVRGSADTFSPRTSVPVPAFAVLSDVGELVNLVGRTCAPVDVEGAVVLTPETVVLGVDVVVVPDGDVVVVLDDDVVVVVLEGDVVVVVVLGVGFGVLPRASQNAMSALLPPGLPIRSGFAVPALYVSPFQDVSCFHVLFGFVA